MLRNYCEALGKRHFAKTHPHDCDDCLLKLIFIYLIYTDHHIFIQLWVFSRGQREWEGLTWGTLIYKKDLRFPSVGDVSIAEQSLWFLPQLLIRSKVSLVLLVRAVLWHVLWQVMPSQPSYDYLRRIGGFRWKVVKCGKETNFPSVGFSLILILSLRIQNRIPPFQGTCIPHPAFI